MAKSVLDPKKLLGFRVLSEDELSGASTISVKAGAKVGAKPGKKPPPNTD